MTAEADQDAEADEGAEQPEAVTAEVDEHSAVLEKYPAGVSGRRIKDVLAEDGDGAEQLAALEEQSSSDSAAGEEQLAAAKRTLLIAIGALFAPEGAVPAVCRSVVTEAVPASFAVTVEAEAAPAAAAGLISELVARGEARIDSISLTVDLAEANKRRRAAAQESKDAARAALLFGRPLTGRERPADDAVPCVVTLKGPDPRCLAAVGEEIGRELRKGGAKRPRDAGGSRDDGERSNRRSR